MKSLVARRLACAELAGADAATHLFMIYGWAKGP